MQVVFLISSKDSHSFLRRTTGKSISGCRRANAPHNADTAAAAFGGGRKGRCFSAKTKGGTSAATCASVRVRFCDGDADVPVLFQIKRPVLDK